MGDMEGKSGLEGRRVLVIGGSGGIGRVIGQHLCASGAHVAFAARRGSLCEEAAKEADGAALPYLQESGGTAVFLSSVASYTGPWPGLGVYASTKAALNRMIDTWRAEYPELGFARINVGPTASSPTTIAVHEKALSHQARWPGLGLVSGAQAESMSIARTVALVLADPGRVWDVTVQPRDAALPWPGP